MNNLPRICGWCGVDCLMRLVAAEGITTEHEKYFMKRELRILK